MSGMPIRFLLVLWVSLTSLSAMAGTADDDLRTAAKLHRAGDTGPAVAIWKDWAAKGNVDAAYNLAVIHQHADGVPLDYAAALRWYRQAADQGDKVAQFQIGLMYQNGQGVAADEAEAHRWFTMHRKHHLHHAHEPQMVAWREQALALIEERDRREQVAASRAGSALVVADLRRRAGLDAGRPTETAALETTTTIR
ncbi:MAG: sel1 repeat family protein [Gammaproteobacteria bacterium]|nr:sel1 repeat family protein [Gammaproteobacteria bacterium]MBU1600818.1 sel1 repeat family protein [Gammaproteobacteria bacterium]MBU2435274.1 sel1 repeat family protein [Gammaproteobacteria bacterium]MBU2448688.1 sel1 repeat family protein [Gammaproteobacteria bacterium]